MKTLKQIERLRKIHESIKKANTGTPREFAYRLNISERQVYNYIEYLREIDAPILYDRKSNTYYYTADFDLMVSVSIKVMYDEEIRNIYAGTTNLCENFLYNNLTII